MKGILKLVVVSAFIGLFSTLSFAAEAPFTAGKEYIDAPAPKGLPPLSAKEEPNKIQVVEFFSFACPHCAELEPSMEKWVKANSDKIDFHRIPVEWNRGWDNLAKAYYVAEQLKVLDKVTLPIFDAMRSRKLDPADVKQIAAIFKENANISEEDFMKSFDSFGVNVAETRGQQWTTAYKIRGVPAIVIGAHYQTDAGKAGSIERLPAVMDYLIELSGQQKK
jgi:thiol:disulfide interchange protein DsbA